MLADDLKTLLATQYAFVIKAQFFHWNVEGSNFGQLHRFFGKISDEVRDSAIDQTGEFIRVMDEYTPGSFERFGELSQITGQTKVPRARLMLTELLADNQTLLDLLNRCFQSAEEENQQGIADFLASRIDSQGRHGWMMKSYLKEDRE